MTSKEKIEELHNFIDKISNKIGTLDYLCYQHYLDDIEKDLEELEYYRKAKELIEKMHKNYIYYKIVNDEIVKEDRRYSRIVYDFNDKEIYIYEYEFCASYLIDEYGITWGFSREELANNGK